MPVEQFRVRSGKRQSDFRWPVRHPFVLSSSRIHVSECRTGGEDAAKVTWAGPTDLY